MNDTVSAKKVILPCQVAEVLTLVDGEILLAAVSVICDDYSVAKESAHGGFEGVHFLSFGAKAGV